MHTRSKYMESTHICSKGMKKRVAMIMYQTQDSCYFWGRRRGEWNLRWYSMCFHCICGISFKKYLKLIWQHTKILKTGWIFIVLFSIKEKKWDQTDFMFISLISSEAEYFLRLLAIFSLLFFLHLYWSIIALQCCVSFCCITASGSAEVNQLYVYIYPHIPSLLHLNWCPHISW